MISTLIALMHSQAAAKYPELQKTWITVSGRLAGQISGGPFVFDAQQCGHIDLLIRCLEDEFDPQNPNVELTMMVDTYKVMLSNMWIGAMYEIFRSLNQVNKEVFASKELSDIYRHLRMLRVSIEKHEIARDHKLKEPLQLVASPRNGDETDFREYDPKSPNKHYILPTSVHLDTGSVGWAPIDVDDAQRQPWLYRREISDRILCFWMNFNGIARVELSSSDD